MATQFFNGGIPLIFDKSAFQSFSFEELQQLNKYYKVNIPPVLIREILGDLVKIYKDGSLKPDRVKDFANKLYPFPFNSPVNTNYLNLIRRELLGELIPFYNAIIDTVQVVKMPNGNIANKFYQSDEEHTLERWQRGEFSEIDIELSKNWRETTTQESLLTDIKNYFKNYPKLKELKTQEQILELFEKLLESPLVILQLIIKVFSIPVNNANQIFYRWATLNNKDIKKFSPYSVYCLRATILFYISSLRNEKFWDKPTNIIDLNYLYYLPFCRLFVSNDKVHHELVPFLINKNQYYIKGEEMREDLKKIIEIKASLTGKDLERAEDEPPRFPELLSYKLWNKILVGWPRKVDWEPTEEEFRKMNEMITQFRNAKPIE